MSIVDQAQQTQLRNIQAKTGKTLDELKALVAASGLAKHSEILAMLKKELGLGHGDANAVAHFALKAATTPAGAKPAATGGDAVLDEIYTGPKAPLRPIHDKLMARIHEFGDFEIAPKKGYVSLRRKKQFAMIGPATNTRVEVGLNLKDVPGTARLEQQPPKGMCSHKVKVTDPAEVDSELIGWLRMAYDGAA
ncbi:DUF5655 domain-containing protein [Paludibaculum fermentans]|uniref:DUF4287 domain-containing protein n=1 Tax=Paludibaculum fermentans TaxID=1473598 RepID=A0A7S7NT51_PALFE|nr:DUF5655 domain-containing protein [Paludibaculum fermentans]QOY89356.1 DUF4287 domain-containing protein [Paludibaculum fermentans]